MSLGHDSIMKELLDQYSTRAPEIVFEWTDAETEARGWVVINSLRGGAAGGGTRMRKGLDRNEVVSLAKTMEIKFTVSGPQIGGAKSGIDFDPADPRKEGVLRRWYRAVTPLLKHYYGTGGDLNVDAGLEVIPMTEACGVWHPQEGVFNGHFKPDEAQKVRRIGRLRQGVSKVVEDADFLPDGGGVRYRVADMITGYGVAESVRHFYDLYGGSVRGKRVLVQGWGNVGAAAALYLAQRGAVITGIIDRVGGLLRPDGMGLDEVRELFLSKTGQCLVDPRSRQLRGGQPHHLGCRGGRVPSVRRVPPRDRGPARPDAGRRPRGHLVRGQRPVCRQGHLLRAHFREGRPRLCRDSGLHCELWDGPCVWIPDGRW